MIGGDAKALRAAPVCIGVSNGGSKGLITVIARIGVSKNVTTIEASVVYPLSCIAASGYTETSCYRMAVHGLSACAVCVRHDVL